MFKPPAVFWKLSSHANQHVHGRTGSSYWPWRIGQTGSMCSGITENSGAHANNLSKENPPLAKGPHLFHSLLQHLTWQPTRPADQPAHLESVRQPGGPVRPWTCCTSPKPNFRLPTAQKKYSVMRLAKIRTLRQRRFDVASACMLKASGDASVCLITAAVHLHISPFTGRPGFVGVSVRGGTHRPGACLPFSAAGCPRKN